MGRREFDRFMVHVHVGRNRKLRRHLTVPERWCFVSGVLALASESPVRGALLVSRTIAADAEDVADMAGVSKAVAASTLRKLRALDMLTRDDELDADVVHDWDDWQVSPRNGSDPTAARRMALHRDPDLREAIKDRDRGRCRYCGVQVNWADRRGPTGGTYDHVDPDGDNDPANLVVACRGCNSSKGCRTPEAAGLTLLQPGSKSRPKSDLDPDQTKGREVEQKTPPAPPSGGNGQGSIKVELPAGLSGYLVPVADALRRVADGKPGAITPTDAAVAKALQDFSTKDFLPLTADFEHYWLHGPGAGKSMKDVVRTWRNRAATQPDVLRKTPAAGRAPTTEREHDPAQMMADLHERLAADER